MWKDADSFLTLWFLDELHLKERGQDVKGKNAVSPTEPVFVFISESAYWSSATDAYSHFNTLTIHPLKITRIKARLLRSLNNSQCMTSEETTQTSVIKNFIISNKNR